MKHRSVVRSLSAVLVLCASAAGCDGPRTQPSPVAVTAVSPAGGSASGGTSVTIFGVGFKPGATVLFGGIPAEAVVTSPGTIHAKAPAHPGGAVDILVTNSDGHFGILRKGYSYDLEPVFTISGVVTELTADGETPVEGVTVTEGAAHTWARTDARGAYRLSGLRQGNFPVWMGKPAYDTVTTPVQLTSDMQLNVRVQRYVSFVLSGMVYETTPNGRVPLQGVVLYCDACGSPEGHTFVTTDANGLYRFAWTRNGKNWIDFISKDGYTYAGPHEFGSIPVIVDGDTTFDIELVKR